MSKKPNVLFFFSDQQRWDTCGCYGQKLDVTPNLDKMAAEGVRFENAFTCQPVCGPARACLQTGKYATETGCFINSIALPEDELTIAKQFSAAGYQTAYIGKWHLASSRKGEYRDAPVPPEKRGGYKDYWMASDVLEFTSHGYDGHVYDGDMNRVDFKGYRADCITEFVLDYLRNERDDDRPFFLFVSYIEPHHQNDHHRYEGPEGSKERWANYEVPGDLVGTGGDWRENYPDYLGCCNSLDYNLGRLREELDNLGLADDTLIVYTSDHGSHFCTRNNEYKRSCHDGCTHIPMIVCGPGFTGGKVVDDMVSLIDAPPTLLEAAGIEIPDSHQGRPLQQVVNGAPSDWPKEIFMQISESQIGRAIRTKKWKYSVSVPSDKNWSGDKEPASDVYHEEYLYDLEVDPHERTNLVKDPALAEVREELAGALKRHMAKANEKEPEIRPAV